MADGDDVGALAVVEHRVAVLMRRVEVIRQKKSIGFGRGFGFGSRPCCGLLIK